MPACRDFVEREQRSEFLPTIFKKTFVTQKKIGKMTTSSITPNEEERQLLSCTSAFDALWFCYAPGNQFKKYYRDGMYDDCDMHQKMFSLCMSLRWRCSISRRNLAKNCVPLTKFVAERLMGVRMMKFLRYLFMNLNY